MSSYYSDDEDLDIHVRRRGHSPHPPAVRYVQSSSRPRSYYETMAGSSYLIPERRATVIARSRSRERSRSRDSRSSPPVSQAPAPVIINNRIYNEYSSDDEEDHRLQLARATRRRRSLSRSTSHSRSRSRSSSYMTREEWEAEKARQDLESLRISNEREKEQRRLAKEYREEAELQRAKAELNKIKNRDARAEEEERILKEFELKRLRREDEAAEEKRVREKEAADAVERYKQKEMEHLAKERKQREEKEREAAEAVERWKQKEAERIAKEKREKDEREREYQQRLQDDLAKSGLEEDAIAAILKKEKIKKGGAKSPQPSNATLVPAARPTYTRMARRHLSIETLQTYHVEFDLDVDPGYVLIKRWVPEWEQDQLWKHTKYIREKRSKVLMIEEKKHTRLEPEFEWVRKKSERKRSKSPSLLMYLAGARPT